MEATSARAIEERRPETHESSRPARRCMTPQRHGRSADRAACVRGPGLNGDGRLRAALVDLEHMGLAESDGDLARAWGRRTTWRSTVLSGPRASRTCSLGWARAPRRWRDHREGDCLIACPRLSCHVAPSFDSRSCVRRDPHRVLASRALVGDARVLATWERRGRSRAVASPGGADSFNLSTRARDASSERPQEPSDWRAPASHRGTPDPGTFRSAAIPSNSGKSLLASCASGDRTSRKGSLAKGGFSAPAGSAGEWFGCFGQQPEAGRLGLG
jgi:hypothetical protein